MPNLTPRFVPEVGFAAVILEGATCLQNLLTLNLVANFDRHGVSAVYHSRVIFFAPGVRRVCARCAPGVRQAWRRWLSVFRLDVLKLACEVAEWVLQYSSNR